MVEVIDFGLKNYSEVLILQESLFREIIKNKNEGIKGKEYVLIGEHYPVITLGRRAKESNVLMSKEFLKNKGIELFHIGRGGDVTYHCTGQMIVYPILDLEKHKLGVKDYVNILEETVIKLLEKYGIKGERIEGATGVWISKNSSNERKICALGIKCSHFCTMHGLALNVNADLSGFSLINPCGFQDKGVTSIESELNSLKKSLDMKEIKREFLNIFLSLVFPFQKVLYLPE